MGNAGSLVTGVDLDVIFDRVRNNVREVGGRFGRQDKNAQSDVGCQGIDGVRLPDVRGKGHRYVIPSMSGKKGGHAQ